MDSIKEVIGYHNYANTGVHEAAERVTAQCPDGWRGTAVTQSSEALRLTALAQRGFAFEVGQVRVRSSDSPYPLYAYNIEAMVEHNNDFKVVFGMGSKPELVAKQQPGPPKQYPARFELRMTEEDRAKLTALSLAAGVDESEWLRRSLRSAAI